MYPAPCPLPLWKRHWMLVLKNVKNPAVKSKWRRPSCRLCWLQRCFRPAYLIWEPGFPLHHSLDIADSRPRAGDRVSQQIIKEYVWYMIWYMTGSTTIRFYSNLELSALANTPLHETEGSGKLLVISISWSRQKLTYSQREEDSNGYYFSDCWLWGPTLGDSQTGISIFLFKTAVKGTCEKIR